MTQRLRHLLVAGGIALAVALLASLALDAWAEHRLAMARRAFDQEILRSSGEATLPRDNGARPLLEKVAEIETLGGPGGGVAGHLPDGHPDSWSLGDRRRLAARLVAHRGALEFLRGAAALEDADLAAGAGAETIERITSLRRAATLLQQDAGLALAAGRPDDAMTTGLALGTLVRAMRGERTSLAQLAAGDVERRYLETVRWLLETTGEPAHLEALRSRLWTEPAATTFRRLMRYEAERMAQALLDPEEPGDLGTGAVWARRLAPWWLTLDAVDVLEAFREYAGIAEHPFPQAVGVEVERLRGPQRPVPRVVLLTLFPNFTHALGELQALSAARRLACRSLTLRLLAAERGRYPPPAELPFAPEPDPLSGEPPRYTVEADGSATLAAEGARRVWEEHLASPHSAAPPLVWHLPAPRE